METQQAPERARSGFSFIESLPVDGNDLYESEERAMEENRALREAFRIEGATNKQILRRISTDRIGAYTYGGSLVATAAFTTDEEHERANAALQPTAHETLRAENEWFAKRKISRALQHEREPEMPLRAFRTEFEQFILPILKNIARNDSLTDDYVRLYEAYDETESEDADDLLEDLSFYMDDYTSSHPTDNNPEQKDAFLHLRELIKHTREALASESNKHANKYLEQEDAIDRIRNTNKQSGKNPAERPVLRFAPIQPAETGKQTESDTKRFVETYLPENRQRIEKLLSLNVNTLTYREQEELTHVLHSVNDQDVRSLGELGKQTGLGGIRTYLALSEAGLDARQTLDRMKSELGERLYKAVIAQHNELLDLADTETARMRYELFENRENAYGFDDSAVRQNLLLRANRYIVHVNKTDTDDIKRGFAGMRNNMILFASVFRNAFKGQRRVPFEELKGIELNTTPPKELTDAEREEMLRIAQDNWKDVKLKHAALKSLKEKFDANARDTRFYLLKKDNELIGFLRFDDLPDGSLYAGSLNISPAMRGSAIGEALLNEVIAREGKDRPIHAHADPRADVLTAYVERFGFVVEGTEDVKIKKGEIIKGVRIRKDPNSYRQPASMDGHLTQKQILAMQTGHEHAPFRVQTYDLKRDSNRMIRDIEQETGRGRAVTRFFENKNQPGSRVVVYDSPAAPAASRAA